MLKTIALIGLARRPRPPVRLGLRRQRRFILLWNRGLRPHRADAVADAFPAFVEPRQREQGASESWRRLGSPSWRLQSSPSRSPSVSDPIAARVCVGSQPNAKE
jgi:hypothetical protein